MSNNRHDDAEESMFMSMGSINHSVSQSIQDANRLLGKADEKALQLVDADQLSKSMGGEIIASGRLESLGHGRFRMELRGPDAPVQARIMSSMLDGAGAMRVGRASANPEVPTDRYVSFTLLPGQEQAVAARFQQAASDLNQNQDALTKVMTASGYLDEKKDTGMGSKLIPTVEVDRNGNVGFPITLDTNDKDVIASMQSEGLQARSSGESFRRSDMERMSNGETFKTSADQLESLLKAVHKAGGPQTLVAPKRQAIEGPKPKALPFVQREEQRDAERGSDSKIGMS